MKTKLLLVAACLVAVTVGSVFAATTLVHPTKTTTTTPGTQVVETLVIGTISAYPYNQIEIRDMLNNSTEDISLVAYSFKTAVLSDPACGNTAWSGPTISPNGDARNTVLTLGSGCSWQFTAGYSYTVTLTSAKGTVFPTVYFTY